MSRRLLLTFALLFLSVPQQAAAQAGGVESLRQTSKAFATVARRVAPSVVFIQVEGRQAVRSEALPFGDDLLRRFFGEDFPGRARPGTPGRSRKVSSQGSGFVFASNGGTTYILTNSHVLENAERIRVRFQDGREFDARIRGSDPKSDVAVIEIAARDLPALAWGDSSNLEVGEWVVAMGNPFGLSHTLTVGVVSAKGRTSLGINDYEDFIQTDAAINPGNSGGPLVNLNAEVVGMNTAIFSRSGGYMGVGFAIPSKLARTIAEQLVAQGRVTRGYLGVTVQKLTTDVAAPLGLKEGQGVLVAEVGEGSPAARAGLRPGDVLLSFDDAPLNDGGQYRNRAALASPGSTVTLGILRDGRKQDLRVKVGRLDEQEAPEDNPGTGNLGLTVRAPTPEQIVRLRLKPGQGVVVTAVARSSIAALAGLRPGAAILEVNRRPVASADEFARAVEVAEGQVVLLLSENGRTRHLTLSRR